jgi:hypothetical protein
MTSIETGAFRFIRSIAVPSLAALSLALGSPQATTPEESSAPERPPPAVGTRTIVGPDGEPTPFARYQELEQFLAEAGVVSKHEIPAGINRPLKVLLEKDGVRVHAVFRTVSDRRPRFRAHHRVIVRFRDHYAHEIAAYRLSRMLGLDLVPPAVLRAIGGDGSLQVWIEGAITEASRRRQARRPARHLEWRRQWQIMKVFDALIDNFDRNQGNIHADPSWNLWLIDHGRAFTIDPDLARRGRLVSCERRLLQRLEELHRDEVVERLGELLERHQIDALMERRSRLVRHFEELIAERGEAAVLFDHPLPGAASLEDVAIPDSQWDRLPEQSQVDGVRSPYDGG